MLEVCACGSDGVSQRHERHLLHTSQSWQTGVEEVAGQNLGMFWTKVCRTVLGKVNNLQTGIKTGDDVKLIEWCFCLKLSQVSNNLKTRPT